MLSTTYTAPATLFNLDTGKISQHFKSQLDLCGISLRSHISHLAKDHIRNVALEMDINGCFQYDLDFYKNRNVSQLNLTYEQALVFLEEEYSHRVDIMPLDNIRADAIVACGVEATMHKRFDAIKTSIQQGHNYLTIHFIAKDEASQELAQRMIEKTYSELLKGIKVNFVLAKVNLNLLQEGLKILKEQKRLSDKCVIVTDVAFAPKIASIAKPILSDGFLGIVATSIKDWSFEMNLYGYEKALGSRKKAVVAWASSILNIKAREVHAELNEYTRLHRVKNQNITLACIGVICLLGFTKFVGKVLSKQTPL